MRTLPELSHHNLVLMAGNPDFIYCFIRKDISYVQQIIQLAHAAYQAGKSFSEIPGVPHICLFEVADTKELKQAWRFLTDERISFEMFFEPDNKMGYSSIVTTPISDMDQRAKFNQFRLYKADTDLDEHTLHVLRNAMRKGIV